jgi:hypothetical protein
MSTRDGDSRHVLRLRLRPGDEWRERVLHEVEVVDGSGAVVRILRTGRIETVRVLSLVTNLDATTDGPARRWVRVRRTPEPTPESVAEGSSSRKTVPEPYEILVSSLGEIALPSPEDEQPADDAARAGLLAGLVSRFAPGLPEEGLAVGEKSSRVMSMRFVSGARSTPAFVQTETVTLDSVGAGDKGGDVAVLTIARHAEQQTVPLADASLAAPKPGALIVSASRVDLDLKVYGASGVGKLTFDATRGVMLSYRVRETLGISAKLGGASVRRTLNVTFEIERLE